MARSLNKAMIIGNVGQDPEIRTISNGSRVAQFSVATSKRWNGRDGQQQEKTEWHRVVAWDKPFNLVDIVDKYVKKGDRIYVEGEIEYRQYEDKDGVTKYTTEIRARDVVLLGGGRGDGEGEGGGGRSYGGGRSGGGGGGGGYGGGGGGGAQRPAAGGGGAPAKGGGGRDYDDFQAPPFEDDDDLPF